jgi:DNA-binding CsgD family transcriptional regulator/tetratricopeptide (TPR) repeat protein
LHAGLRAAHAGQGRLFLLVGVAGAGKTRLAEETAAAAATDGFQVFAGRCIEGEGAPPLWPWVQIVRAYARSVPAKTLRAALGTAATAIAQVVPEVSQQPLKRTPGASLAPQGARFRFFDGLVTFLKNVAAARPLVLILDDLHWVDTASLLALEFLAREMRDARLLVVATYRDMDFKPGHPLPEVLGELVRQQTVERITLGGLTEADIAEWLGAVAPPLSDLAVCSDQRERSIEKTPGAAPPDLVRRIFQRTEGNPFFVTEVVRLLLADGSLEHPERVRSAELAIPQTVREAIGRRLGRLSPASSDVLRVAAVIGCQFDLSVLAPALVDAVSAEGRRSNGSQKGRGTTARSQLGHVQQVLGEAVAARVLSVSAPGQHSFVHALIREVLYADLPLPTRVQLHRRIGGAIAQLHTSQLEPHLAALSHHFSEAALAGIPATDDAERAIDYAVRSAHYATQQLSYEEAARQYRLALTIMERAAQSGGLPLDQSRQCELWLSLAAALDSADDRRSAKPIFHQVIAAARQLHTPEHLARAALGLGGWLALTYHDEGTVAPVLQEADRALGETDSALHACVLARLAMELAWLNAPGYLELSERALAMAGRVGDPVAFAWSMHARHSVVADCTRIPDLLAVATAAVTMAETAHDPALSLMGRRWRIYDLLVLGDIAAAAVELSVYRELATEQRLVFHVWSACAYENLLALLAGRFETVEEAIVRTRAVGQRLQHMISEASFTAQMHVLLREREQFPAGIAAALKQYADANAHHYAARCTVAMMYVDAGQLADARRELEYFALGDFVEVFGSIDWLICTALLAEVCAALGDARSAEILYRRLLPSKAYMVVANPSVLYGSVAYYLGMLATTMCHWEDAIRHFDDALARHRKMGARPLIARAQSAYARALVGRHGCGDLERARGLLEGALEIATHLGMHVLQSDLSRLERNISASSLMTAVDAEYPSVELHDTLRARYGLTPAESRLAVGLCGGTPLGSAARALNISVHTARTQLKQVFAKTHTRRQVELVRLLLAGLVVGSGAP